MYGIVGAIAQRPVAAILLEGLRRLEYRGYDSSGVCFVQNNELEVVRAEGKLKLLEDKLAGMELVILSEDAEAKSVTARFPLLANETATLRDGYGCVLEPWEP